MRNKCKQLIDQSNESETTVCMRGRGFAHDGDRTMRTLARTVRLALSRYHRRFATVRHPLDVRGSGDRYECLRAFRGHRQRWHGVTPGVTRFTVRTAIPAYEGTDARATILNGLLLCRRLLLRGRVLGGRARARRFEALSAGTVVEDQRAAERRGRRNSELQFIPPTQLGMCVLEALRILEPLICTVLIDVDDNLNHDISL